LGLYELPRTRRLIKVIGTLKGDQHAQILQRCIPPMIKKQKMRGSIFQEDNARVHFSKVTIAKKEALGLKHLIWPAYLLDFNLIEDTWSYLKDRIRRMLPQNIKELERICIQEWQQIPPVIIRSHIESMPRRLEALDKADGGHIKY